MKLNLEKFQPPKKIIPPAPKGSEKYASPVGWWKVETEGDCEGRSIKQLGVYYGHVAEIAFSIQEIACYEYTFMPAGDLPEPKERPKYLPVRSSATVGLNINSNTWNLQGQARVNWWKNWLNSEDVIVKSSNYYKAVHIELAPHLIG